MPYLDVLGTVESKTGEVALFVVNRNPKSSQAASIRLSGFSPARDVKVLTLAAPSLLDKNDEERPNAVRPAESHEVLRGNTLQRVFPAGSVTVCLFWGSGNDGGLASAASGPRGSWEHPTLVAPYIIGATFRVVLEYDAEAARLCIRGSGKLWAHG